MIKKMKMFFFYLSINDKTVHADKINTIYIHVFSLLSYLSVNLKLIKGTKPYNNLLLS